MTDAENNAAHETLIDIEIYSRRCLEFLVPPADFEDFKRELEALYPGATGTTRATSQADSFTIQSSNGDRDERDAEG